MNPYSIPTSVSEAEAALATVQFMADMHIYHLFDALLQGAFGNVDQGHVRGRCYMYEMYPCGIIHVADNIDAGRFDIALTTAKGV